MSKKVSVIGKGTVGCLSALKFSNLGYDIDWYHDPNTPALSVGEGVDLALPKFLNEETDLNYDKIIKMGAHYKQGIEKINWGNKPFTHWFGLGNMALHIDASKIQNYIIDRIKDKVNIISKKIEHSDAKGFIIDCSGTPLNINDLELTPIPVNNSYIVQCPWDKPRFSKTICIAKSYGWVFLIPLQNRCSVGYLYNKNFCSLSDIKHEIDAILLKYNLISNSSNNLPFENYYRKINWTENVSYNGNASFFLEPLEATSLHTSIKIINSTAKYLAENNLNIVNKKYKNYLEETIDIIMLHYLVDPPVKNTFWSYANEKAYNWFKTRYKTYPKINLITKGGLLSYSTWHGESFKQNLKGLDLYDKLNQLQNG